MPFVLVIFYLYVYLPFGDEHPIKREKGPWVKVLDLLLSLAFLLLAPLPFLCKPL